MAKRKNTSGKARLTTFVYTPCSDVYMVRTANKTEAIALFSQICKYYEVKDEDVVTLRRYSTDTIKDSIKYL